MKIDWKHLFNWDVVSVKAPVTVMNKGRVIGYKVVVTYKYHGTDEEFYSTDEERFYRLWTGPQDAARASYKQHLRKMTKQAGYSKQIRQKQK